MAEPETDEKKGTHYIDVDTTELICVRPGMPCVVPLKGSSLSVGMNNYEVVNATPINDKYYEIYVKKI